MNAETAVRPEVAAFVERVRHQLGDLDAEQREELLEGLDADLSEQLAAGDALPDPVAYAAELRSAAGLDGAPRRGLRLGRRTLSVEEVLDRCRAQWEAWTGRNQATRQVWGLAVAMRPAWWVLRAWLAVTFVDQVTGPWEYVTLWPTLGAPLVGPVVLAAAVVVSALIGLDGVWPGSGPDRTTTARVLLLALNAVAVVVPLTFVGDGSQQFRNSAAYAVDSPTRADRLVRGGHEIRNIYAYDAAGQPLEGVQLFDQRGRPVAVSTTSSSGFGRRREVVCPWFNGTTPLFNVFPLPERTQRQGTCLQERQDAGEESLQAPPLAAVPAAALPDVPPAATP